MHKEVFKVSFQTNGVEGKRKPKSLQALQAVFHRFDCRRWNEEREQHRREHKTENKLREPLPDYVQRWLFCVFCALGIGISPVDANGKSGNSQQHVLGKLDDSTDFQGLFSDKRPRGDHGAGSIYTTSEPSTRYFLRKPHPMRQIRHK